MSWLTRKKSMSATPAVLDSLSAGSPYIALGGTNINRGRISGVFVEVQNASYGWIYKYNPTVRTVISYIASNIAQLGLKLYERLSDDERKQRGDHAAAEVMRNPNLQTPGEHFIYKFVTDFLVYNNAYALKLKQGSSPLTIVSLNPAMVGLVGQSHFAVEAYRIYRKDGTFFDRPPEDIIHWRGDDPEDPRKGFSKLETLRQEVASDRAVMEALTELAERGFSMRAWLERPLDAPEITEQGFERLKEQVTNQARSANRSLPIFEEGMQLKQGGVSPEDAQVIESRKLMMEQVAGIFGMCHVPPESEEERRQFYADVLPPLCEMLCAFLNLQVLKQEYDEDDFYFEFNLDEKLITDDRLKTLISAAGAPIYTRNEARAVINLPPIKGGDKLIVPLNVTDGDPSKPSPATMPVQDPNKPPQDGSHRTEDVPTPAGKALEVVSNGNGHVKDVPLVPRRARTFHRRDSWGREYIEKFTHHFSRQRQHLSSKKITNADEERWNEELAADLLEISQRQFAAEGRHPSFRMASEFDPEQGQHYLDAKAVGAAVAINKTTTDDIEEKGLLDAFLHAINVRAIGAGMSYATDVHAFAAKSAIQQRGMDVEVTIDGGDCEICAPFQGTWKADEVPAWPSYHPNCDCVVDVRPIKADDVRNEALLVLAKAVSNGDRNEDIKLLAKAISEQKAPQINVAPAETHIHEGAVKSHTTVEAPPPAELTIAEGAVQVDAKTTVEAPPPSQTHIHKGAVQNHVKVDPPPPTEVNIAPTEVNVAPAQMRLGKGAITVESPPPANFNMEEGAIKVEPTEVNVQPPEVNVSGPPIENHVHVPKESSKRTITFSDGTEAKIVDNTVTFSDGSEAVIKETDERPDKA